MCGISGLVNCGDTETLVRMTNVQAHRGPDDSGVWERHFPGGGYMSLGSRRLAILDLSADGHMPMSNEDGTVWITYNGEVYNFAELRHELEGKGHYFRSHTDTEAVVHLYEEYGVDCLNRLNGMFALAICDMRGASPKLLLARDHFGIKPLYYWERGGKLAFASEVKALANQTAKATEEISAQVAAMQSSTSDAVLSIGGITETIAQMSEITTSIAASVQQQGEATREIARNIQSAAAGSSEINAHIGGVTTAAAATGLAASDVLSNARELDNQSGMLRHAVDEFLAKIRAA